MKHVSRKALQKKIERFHIKERDIVERFIKSGGPGGQNINKVASGVYVRHLPTGIQVKCTCERSQAMNRFMARAILINKIAGVKTAQASQERREKEKKRRQNRKRSKNAKAKMLNEKRKRSEKKERRKKVTLSGYE